jgi:predicted dehydrogenase
VAPCSTSSLQPGRPSPKSPHTETISYFENGEDRPSSKKEIRIGIVGADAKASWAKVSHIPAIKGLPGLKLAALATRHAPGFEHALHNARLIEAVKRAAERGERQTVA